MQAFQYPGHRDNEFHLKYRTQKDGPTAGKDKSVRPSEPDDGSTKISSGDQRYIQNHLDRPPLPVRPMPKVSNIPAVHRPKPSMVKGDPGKSELVGQRGTTTGVGDIQWFSLLPPPKKSKRER